MFRQGPDRKKALKALKLNLVSKWRVPQAEKGSGKGGNRDRHQDFEGRNRREAPWSGRSFFCLDTRNLTVPSIAFQGIKMITIFRLYYVVHICSYHKSVSNGSENVVSGCNLRADMASLPYCCAEGPPDYADAASAASERSQRQQNRQRFLSGNSGGLVFEMCTCAS